MKWLLYDLGFLLAYPFLLLLTFLPRMLKRGGYVARMGDRFALYPEGLFDPKRPLFDSHAPRYVPSAFVWVHAVSVGEAQVAGQLMREWRKAEPGVRFCLSTTSSTGWGAALRETTPNDILIYNPLDFPNFVKSALRTVRPRAIVLTESEIWPCFILKARKMGIPLFLINARVSDRSAPRYRLARWWFRDVFACFTRIFAQSERDRDRLCAAGAPAGRIEVTGSFKFDAARRNEAKEAELRDWVGNGRILLGGSTWPGEDEVLLGLYRRLLDRPDGLGRGLKLVIAPRHFEKAEAIVANIRRHGFACVRRSAGEKGPSGAKTGSTPPVYLADTTGELMGLYGIADAVFVGKSLCAHGSQNMIEPCLCGKPTVVGPYTENFRPVMSDLLAADAIVQAEDAEGVERALVEALADGQALGERAGEAVRRRRGVVPRCVRSIREFLA